MTRIGFVLFVSAFVLLTMNGFDLIDHEHADVVPVGLAVAGAVMIAIDAERDDEPAGAPKADPVPLGGGGRLGPITRFGFLIGMLGVVLIGLRMAGLVDSELADIASACAVVVGAMIIAVDGEREVRSG